MNQVGLELIERLIPYRKPMLLIDRCRSWAPRKEIIVETEVCAQDVLVATHLINGPKIMPGVLMIELVGQAGLLLERLTIASQSESVEAAGVKVTPCRTTVLVQCKAKFYKPAHAGHVLIAKVNLEAQSGGGSLHHGRLFVDDELVADIEILSARASPEQGFTCI